MNRRPLVAATASLAALSVGLCATLPAPSARLAAAAPQPPMDAAHLAQVKSLYAEKCSACHNLYDPNAMGFTRAEWQRTVDRMLNRHHASDSIAPAEAAQIVDYLATFAPPPNARNGRGGVGNDPWATQADDIWTVAPATTRVFNFVAPGSLAEFGMISAGTPGPAPVWQAAHESASPDGTAALVRPVAPTPSRFSLLMDRKDQPRNLDIRVRFRIQAGKVSPAVGIVFGFAGPKSYDVLAYNQARNDLSLLKIAEPAHTTLQQTPITLPPPATGPLTAAGEPPPPVPASPSGWHTLRLLVKDGQIRGWLDMNKRISTQDATYQGGKVGLWAQGDTVAAFQDWLVDIYDGVSPAPPAGA